MPKHLLIGLGLAVLLYVLFFSFDQYVRHRKGPWEVNFTTNQAGFAAIEISQSALGIRSTVIFAGETATNQGRRVFEKPGGSLPFGTIKFEDLTYLPGSVAFDFFGHEVELLPRTLYLNKQEYPWRHGEVQVLQSTEKLPPGASYDPRKRKKRR